MQRHLFVEKGRRGEKQAEGLVVPRHPIQTEFYAKVQDIRRHLICGKGKPFPYPNDGPTMFANDGPAVFTNDSPQCFSMR